MNPLRIEVLKRGAAATLALAAAVSPAFAGGALGQMGELQKSGFESERDGGASLNCLFEAHCAGGAPAAAPAVSESAGEPSSSLGVAAKVAGAGSSAKGVPPPPAAAASKPGRSAKGTLDGAEKGAEEGALLGFYAALSPAVGLMSEGFGRNMSRHYDGAGSGNGHGAAYETAGIALAVVLYVPALAVAATTGLIGAAAGAGSELASPGSTQKWDAETFLFGR